MASPQPNSSASETLDLEKQLFSAEGAGTVIANSQLVKREIEQHFRYDPAHIHVVYNGVPATTADPTRRDAARPRLRELDARFSMEENVRQTLTLITQ